MLTQPDNSTITYAYTLTGQQQQVTNADGKTTTYSYDDAGLLTGKTEPGNRHTGYSYDSAGRLQTTTLPDGSTQASSYTSLGQLDTIHYSSTGATDLSYGYDADGQRTSMTDATGTSTYGYDANGNLTSESNGAGATVGYSYNGTDQLATITYPGNHTVTYGTDPAGQVTKLTDWAGREIDFGYSPDGQLVSQSDPNGVTTISSYDPSGQITAVSIDKNATNLAAFHYSYDDAGQLITDQQPGNTGSDSHTYGYDPTSQLAAVATTPSGGTATSGTYTATPADNLTADPAGNTYTYNAAQELTTRTPATGLATTYGYDDNGSRTSTTTATAVTHYTYTADQNLARVVSPTSTIDYTSDGDGLRQSRAENGTTKQWTWSTQGSLPLLLDDGDHSYLYGPGSAPVAQIDDVTGAIQYLHQDNIGSTRLITDTNGAAIGTASYDAYGKPASQTGAESAIGYSGNWTDPTTGIVYLRARDYDPATGQFTTVDPLEDTTLQPYAYTANHPLDTTDQSGLFCALIVHDSNGSCWGSGVADNIVLSGPATSLTNHVLDPYMRSVSGWLSQGAPRDIADEWTGFWNGLLEDKLLHLDNQLSAGSSCSVDKNGNYYKTYHVAGVVAPWVLSIFLGGDVPEEPLPDEPVGASSSGGTPPAAGGDDVARLFRAVDPTELKDVEGTGVYRSAPGGTEGKYFFPTQSQAENFSNMMEKVGTGPYCITSGCIPLAKLQEIETIHPAGEGIAYFIPQDLLPFFNNLIVHGR